MHQRRRLESVMLSEEEVRIIHKKIRPPPTGYCLGSVVDWLKIERKLTQVEDVEVEEITPEIIFTRDPYKYIGEDLKWVEDHKCRVLYVPDSSHDLAVLKNWIWVKGRVENLDSLGVTSKFTINLSLAKVPCLVCSNELLPIMNNKCRGEGHGMYTVEDLTLASKDPLRPRWDPAVGNTYFCKDFRVRKWVKAASSPLFTPYLHFVSETKVFEPGSVQFVSIPGSKYLMTPLLPARRILQTPAPNGMLRECSVYSWGILSDILLEKVRG
jgi:hypothetical protein